MKKLEIPLNYKQLEEVKKEISIENKGFTFDFEFKKHKWNYGKRLPIKDELGNLWCNCLRPKLSLKAFNDTNLTCSICKCFKKQD